MDDDGTIRQTTKDQGTKQVKDNKYSHGYPIRVPEQLDRSGEMRVALINKGTKQKSEHGQGKFVCLIDDALSQRTESFRNCGILHKHDQRRDLGADR